MHVYTFIFLCERLCWSCFSFYECLAGLYKNGQLVEHTDSKPWVEDTYWEIKRSNNAIIEEAYKQFNGKNSFTHFCSFCYRGILYTAYNPCPVSPFFTDVLHECRLLNNRAVHVISQTEKSMSLKKQSKQYAIWIWLICVQHLATFCCMAYHWLMYCMFFKWLSYIQMLDNYYCHTHMLCVAVWGICWNVAASNALGIWRYMQGLKTFIFTDMPQFGSNMSYTCTVCILYHVVACIYADSCAA